MFQNNVLAGAAAAAGDDGYEIDNACRFNRPDSAYLYDTLGTATDANRWTYSTWFKRGNLISSGPPPSIFTAGSGGGDTDRGDIVIDTNNQLSFSGGSTAWRLTTQVFRDVGAWYHLVVAVNTDESGDAMIKIYINGSQITAFDTTNNPSGAANTGINTAVAHNIGRQAHGGDGEWDGYMSEINFIDGQQLAPSSFGETNDDGVWVPIKFSGSYGNNGFFLDFESSGDLGNDVSGNSNDFTSSGLTTFDQVFDTPTNNQITFNLLNNQKSGGTLYEGATQYKGPSTRTLISMTANIPSTGKWAMAFGANSVTVNNGWNFGITKGTNSNFGDGAGSNEDFGANDGINMSPSSSNLYLYDYITSTSINPSQAITTSDEFWLAVDMATGKCFLGIYDASATAMVWVAADGGKDGNPATGDNPSATITAMIGSNDYTFGGAGSKTSPAATLNVKRGPLGPDSYSGTLPDGYTFFENVVDFPTPNVADSSEYYQNALWNGNSSTQTITFGGNADMQPDLVWIKARDASNNHVMTDSVRGTDAQLWPDTYQAQDDATDAVTAFNSDGVALGDGSELDRGSVNNSAADYVGWNWKESATAGLDILTYAGTGSNRTISHNLGAVPKMIILKSYDNVYSWTVYHVAMGNTKIMKLDSYEGPTTNSGFWQDTTPTSSVFSVGTHGNVNNGSSNYIAYLWAEVPGFSKFGSYVGNSSSDGPFMWCGFKPSIVIIKAINGNYNWQLNDAGRNPYNVTDLTLFPNGDYTENSGAAGGGHDWDMLSNGFKIRDSGGNVNDGSTFMFAAWAENPFGGEDVALGPAR